jgi:hypothetical protein
LRVLKIPTFKCDGTEACVDGVGGASISAIAVALKVKRANGFVAIGRLDSSDGSLHDQPRQFTDEPFQTSFKFVGTGGCDLSCGKKIVPLR